MVRKNKNKQPLRKGILIIGEGDSERTYFTELKTQERLKFRIKPDLPKNSNYKGIFEKAEENAEDYKLVFCLIDLDHILNSENRSEYEDYKRKKGELSSTYPNIFV